MSFGQSSKDEGTPRSQRCCCTTHQKCMAKSCWIFLKIQSLEAAVCTSTNCPSNGKDVSELATLQDVYNRDRGVNKEEMSWPSAHSAIKALVA